MLRRFLTLLLLTSFIATGAAEPPAAARTEARARAAAAMLVDAPQASWVRDGKSAHVIYVFFDPNCPFCHKVYEMLRPQVERGAVELRWIPVGILMTTSPGKAAAILEAKNPTEAFYKNERDFSRETGTFGGIAEEPLPQDATLKRLERNLTLLRRSGVDAVPALLFRTRDGQAHFIAGAPPAPVLDSILRELE